MDKYMIVAIVIILCIVLVVYTQIGGGASSSNKKFKDIVQNAFPKFKIIEKYKTLTICEMNHRNELDELIFIRIDPNQQKNIRLHGRMMIATYPKEPSTRQMKKDFSQHLGI